MEKGDTDLATFFRSSSITNQPEILPRFVGLYWVQMLYAVRMLHQQGRTLPLNWLSHLTRNTAVAPQFSDLEVEATGNELVPSGLWVQWKFDHILLEALRT